MLASDYHGHQGATYICVDGDEEVVNGYGNEDDGRLYVVEARCGSLPCGPYTDGYEVTCAVCTR